MKEFFAFIGIALVAPLIYFPVARALAIGLIILAKLFGTYEGDIPSYTPFPNF